ncbi:MAG: PAS domain S-box protein, partial [Chloroflexi bacterium]|nr:PAS domain S-box protein [Chloroflexota bacterium]
MGDEFVRGVSIEMQPLQESEQKYRWIVENANAAIVVAQDGRLKFFNAKALEFIGYSPQELAVKPFAAFIHPEDREMVVERHLQRLRGKKIPQVYPFRIIDKAGGIKWVEINAVSITWDGQPATLNFFTDITERKQAEELVLNIARGVSAATGETFFRSLVDHLGRTLNADYVLIGELKANQVQRIRTLAIYATGQEVDNIEYDLSHTPCENVVNKTLCSYVSNVQAQFPHDRLLVEMEVEGYVGTPLFDSTGRAMGLMAVLYRRPIPNREEAESLLKIFAARAAAEMERQQMEKALRESEERFSRFSEAAFEGIGIADAGIVIDANRQLAQMLGYELPEIMGMSVMNFIAPESHDLVQQNRLSEYEGPYEHIALRKDGSIFPVEVRAKTLPYKGRVVRVTAIRDITKRKQAEEEIRRRNRELALLNRIIAASAVTPSMDQEAILETACRELALAFNLPHATATLLDQKKMTTTVVAEYSSEDRRATLYQAMPLGDDPLFQHLLSRKMPLVTSEAQTDPDLTLIHGWLRQRSIVSLLLVPLMIEGEVVGGLGLESFEPRCFSTEEINLTWSVADQLAGVLARVQLEEKRRQLEGQYHQAQKMEAVGRLTAGVAHDFNNLLTSISGFTHLIQAELQPNDPLQEMVDTILRSSQRAADLVRQLLAFSRKQIIQPKVLDLNTVVTEMDKMLRRIIGEDINLKTVLTPDLWPVKVDTAQIEQVIVNLAVNARDAMPRGGQLTIETANMVIDDDYMAGHLGTQPGEYVLLAVSDTGCGMSHEVKTRIFEPFFTTKEVGKGTGLGLATIFGIVRQSGGNIWVYSEENVGTTFKIYLPRAQETGLTPARPEIGAEMPSGDETILLVEDDIGVRGLVRQVLLRQGYTLLEAQNGQEALRLSAYYSGPIHLLLTDVVMPGISGKALARELAHTRPDLKILFMSGYTDEAIAHHGVLDPGVAFLQKPF